MRRTESGQTATEYMLLIAVLVVAVVGGAYAFVPSFRGGTEALAADTSTILDGGKLDAWGVDRGGHTFSGPVGGNGCGGAVGRGTPGCDSRPGGDPVLGGKGGPVLGQPVAPEAERGGARQPTAKVPAGSGGN